MATRAGGAVLVYNNIPRVTAALGLNIAGVIEDTAKGVGKTVRASMQEPKHGKHYIIGGKVHIASAPGEPPAVLSGELIGSVRPYQLSSHTWIVPAEGEGAMWEFGMKGLPARPYLRPAVDKAKAGFRADIGKAIKKSQYG